MRFHAVGDDGSRRRLPLERWLRAPEAGEWELLSRAVGPVLDVGCGAGRHVVALRRAGVEAVGIEVSRHATTIARERGGVVIEGSIFEARLPSIWNTALLLDGNIGIGGDPAGLLRRVAGLLRIGGAALVELEPPATVSRTSRVRLESACEVSTWIPWTFVASDEIGTIAGAAGLTLDELWQSEGRWFARLLLGEPVCLP
ncbi:MAG: methyltransferase domain-containing protein [Solirubrobacterales bacterium]|nr:methyltransferase domain-containing protein [Solirubrobacterales bacterium]